MIRIENFRDKRYRLPGVKIYIDEMVILCFEMKYHPGSKKLDRIHMLIWTSNYRLTAFRGTAPLVDVSSCWELGTLLRQVELTRDFQGYTREGPVQFLLNQLI